MKINSGFKPWFSVSDDELRLSVCGAYLDKDAGQLIATDGKMLTRYPVCDTEEDEAGIIPVEALKEAAKLGKKSGIAELTVKGGNVSIGDGRSWPTLKVTFPNYQQVIPDFKATRTRTGRLYLNPELLAAIYKAVDGKHEGAVLEFQLDADDDGGKGPMLVTLPGAALPPAVLMPMRLGARYPERVDDIEEAHAEAAAGAPK